MARASALAECQPPSGMPAAAQHSASERPAPGRYDAARFIVHSPCERSTGKPVPRRAYSASRKVRSNGRLVRHERTAAQELDEVRCQILEARGPAGIGSADAVDALGAEVAIRVHERRPLVLDAAAAVNEDDADLGDAVVVLRG